jgi:parallel beta-helix repeat protein
MKSHRKTKTIILIIVGMFFAFLPIFISNFRINNRDLDITTKYRDEFDYDNLKISKVSGKINISGNVGWADFKAAGNCTGFGTYSEPYVIEDLVIDGDDSGTCIYIENSNVYFRIENCTLFNSGSSGSYYSGIKLISVSNGVIFNNNVNYNDHGIYLNACNNNTVLGNNANNNYWDGIFLETGNNNSILGNIVNSHYGSGIGSWYSYNNIIKENIVEDNGLGISLEYSDNNKISGNTVIISNRGIHLKGSDNCAVLENDVKENYYGMYIEDGALENLIYLNNLTDNIVNALDDGIYNQWDNGSIGNYWDDYPGVDENDDGIGDTPYYITGTADSEDYFPIWDDGPDNRAIPGYYLFILLGIISVVAILTLVSKKR